MKRIHVNYKFSLQFAGVLAATKNRWLGRSVVPSNLLTFKCYYCPSLAYPMLALFGIKVMDEVISTHGLRTGKTGRPFHVLNRPKDGS